MKLISSVIARFNGSGRAPERLPSGPLFASASKSFGTLGPLAEGPQLRAVAKRSTRRRRMCRSLLQVHHDALVLAGRLFEARAGQRPATVEHLGDGEASTLKELVA